MEPTDVSSNASGKNESDSHNAVTRLKLVEYDESESSNDSSIDNKNKNVENVSLKDVDFADQDKLNSSDSEKSEDEYSSSKQLSAQDINLIIMGGSDKPDVISDNLSTVSTLIDPNVMLEPIPSTSELQNEVYNKDPNKSCSDKASDIVAKNIKLTETELIQITEIDFNKLPLDDHMPDTFESGLQTVTIEKGISAKVDETDDEMEFFDCENESVQNKSLGTVLESVEKDIAEGKESILMKKMETEKKLCAKSISEVVLSDEKEIVVISNESDEVNEFTALKVDSKICPVINSKVSGHVVDSESVKSVSGLEKSVETSTKSEIQVAADLEKAISINSKESGEIAVDELIVINSEEAGVIASEESSVITSEESGKIALEEPTLVGVTLEESFIVASEESGAIASEKSDVIDSEKLVFGGSKGSSLIASEQQSVNDSSEKFVTTSMKEFTAFAPKEVDIIASEQSDDKDLKKTLTVDSKKKVIAAKDSAVFDSLFVDTMKSTAIGSDNTHMDLSNAINITELDKTVLEESTIVDSGELPVIGTKESFTICEDLKKTNTKRLENAIVIDADDITHCDKQTDYVESKLPVEPNKITEEILIKCSNLLDESLEPETSGLEEERPEIILEKEHRDQVDKIEIKLDNRKVEPLKLNLNKPNLKRPNVTVSTSVPTKMVKNVEHEPLPKLLIKKGSSDESTMSESVGSEVPDNFLTTPKVIIKPIKKPTELGKSLLPDDIVSKPETVTVSQNMREVSNEKIIPKLTLKLPVQSKDLSSESDTDDIRMNDELIPKLTSDASSKEVTSESETDESKFSDEVQTVPKLTLKISHKAEESIESVNQVSSTQTIPKLTIRTSEKLKMEVVPKLTLKLNEQQASSFDDIEQKVPKLTLKLATEEQSIVDSTGQLSKETSESEYEEEAVQKSVPRLTIKIPSDKEQENHKEPATVPKLMIKLPAEKEPFSNADSDVLQTIPKLTIKLPVDKDDSVADKDEHTHIPKLTIKSVGADKPIEDKASHQIVPKITIKKSSDKEQTDSDKSCEQHVVPKLTIKSIPKQEPETVPKLTVKLSSTGGHHIENVPNSELIQRLSSKPSFPDPVQVVPKVTIKPIVKPEQEVALKSAVSPIKADCKTSPRVLIKPLPDKDVIPKLTLKLPSDISIDVKNDAHHSREMPKFTIKPIPQSTESDQTKPLEIVTTDKIMESGQDSPRIILKINKTVQGNSTSEILSPSSDIANSQCRSPSIDKIKLKLSKTGQHPHIIHEEQDANAISMKRAMMNPDLDVIEIKRTCVDSVYSRLPPDVSISPVKHQQAFPQEKQTEKQKSEKRLRDILSKLHKKSTEQPQQRIEQTVVHKLDDDNDNSSSSGDCILIEEDSTPGKSTKQIINFGRDIELIRMASEVPQSTMSPNTSTPIRGTMPRKRGRPRKDPNLVAMKNEMMNSAMLASGQFPAQHMLDRLMMNSADSPVRTSRRSTRGRSSLGKGGLISVSSRGRGRGRGTKHQAIQDLAMQQQRMQQLLNLNQQLLQQQMKGDSTQTLRTSELWDKAIQQLAENTETFQNKINTLGIQDQQLISNLDPLQNLQAMTSNIPIDLTGAEDSFDATRLTSPNSSMQTESFPKKKIEDAEVSILSPQGISLSPMKTPGSNRAPRARRARGPRGGRGGSSPKKRGVSLKENPLSMFEEDTRMSADLGTKTVVPTPIKTGTAEGAEESQSSMQSSANENSKSKRGRMEVGDSDGKIEFTVDMIAEYMWPQSELASPTSTSATSQNINSSTGLNNNSGTTNGISGNYDEKVQPEMYMIQEQIAMYLGVTSFKRKYPDVRRRQVEMRERDYIMSRNLVTETLCDLGLTAIPTCEVLDIMSADFPQKYDEYKKYLRDKQTKELAIKQRQMNSDRNKQRSIKDRAISSASSWNTNFFKERMETRKSGCMDLQTYIIQRPKSIQSVRSSLKTKPGNYPVALVPGQFCDYYKKYSPNELRYFPLDTVLYGPQKPNQRSQETVKNPVSDSSESSSSSSESDSDSSSDDSQDEDNSSATCRLCHSNKSGQDFVVCSGCKYQVHAQCAGLMSRESIILSKSYSWRCINCKLCLQCLKPIIESSNESIPTVNGLANGLSHKKSANMLRCVHCDRCAHVNCINNGAASLNTKWFCTLCKTCDSCGTSDPNKTNNDTANTLGLIAQWRRVETPRGSRQLCQSCALMWQEKLYCSMCYLCVLNHQQFMSCKVCTHKLHTDCIRTQFPNMTGNETVTCLECSKKTQNLPKSHVNSLTVSQHQQNAVTSTC